jgi:hypothetical protein
MIKWRKKSGVIVETNDRKENIEAALKLGWVREDGNGSASSKGKFATDFSASQRGRSGT